MARQAAEGADAGRAGDPAGSSADPGETQPVLTRAGTADTPRRRLFSSLHTRNFRLFAGAQVVSNSGTWMQRVAQDWLVLEITHNSGTAIGIVTGLQFLPMLMFSLWGGMIADRYSKRRILMITQGVMGALALILCVLDGTGLVRLWEIYALAFGLGMATVVDNPTRQAFVVEMVGKADLPNAIALNSAVFNLARIAGPALAGLVISVVGTPTAFGVNAASYAAVLVGLRLMRSQELHPAQRVQRAKGQLLDGLRYVRSQPVLWTTMVLVFFVATFGMNFQVTTALMSRSVFGTGAGSFGIASAVFAGGALIGALVAARRRSTSMRLLIATAFAFSLLEIVSALMPTFWSFLILLVPTGLAVLSFTTAANASTQLATRPDMRGRVMGLYMFVFLGGAPFGAPLAGLIAQAFGPRMSMIFCGGVSLAATVTIAAVLFRSRGAPVRSYLHLRPVPQV